jgi:DNA-binding MarR family transcriptional regulator/GNAT superfamily N-acetyltransferase
VTEAIAERVVRVRAFNRSYMSAIGVLNDAYLHTRWNVSEARVIFELAQRRTVDTAALRRDLGLDSGYLSRMLARFEADGLVVRERSESDRRRQTATLTAAGRRAFAQLDRRSARDIGALLAHHSEAAQRRLISAMETISSIVTPVDGAADVVVRTPTSGEYGWVIARHGALYRAEYGWDLSFEGLVAGIVADHLREYDAEREAAWIAELHGEAVGCVFCVRRTTAAAQLRLLLVEPHARGLGIGGMLVELCITFARDAGYTELGLWTNDVLVDARRVYERAGFRLVDEETHHSFCSDIVGQTWALDLTAASR